MNPLTSKTPKGWNILYARMTKIYGMEDRKQSSFISIITEKHVFKYTYLGLDDPNQLNY